MMKRLPEKLHEWLDGELPDAGYEEFIAEDGLLRKSVSDERRLRILTGYALGMQEYTDTVDDPTVHIKPGDLAAFLEERLPHKRMQQLGEHLVKCKRCFYDYMGLSLLDLEDLQPETVPAPLYHRVLRLISPDHNPDPGWLGKLVLQAKGGMQWLHEYVQPSAAADFSFNYSPEPLSEPDETPHLDELSVSEIEALYPDYADKLIQQRLQRAAQKQQDSTRILIGGMIIEVTQRRIRGQKALVINVVAEDTEEAVADLILELELADGESMRVITDAEGRAFLLMPRGDSILRIGYHGYIEVFVE